MLNISFGQSKYFVDNLSENVARGMRQKIRRGDWPGWAPIGYLNDPVSRKVVPAPTKGDLVKKLFETYATGDFTVQSLIKLTFNWGLTNKRGDPLVKDTIYRTFTNPFYFGLLRYKGELFQGTHEPLISKELFDKTQDVLARRGKPRKNTNIPFPLLGFMGCLACGSMITAERQKGHHYYRCTRKKGKCTEPYVREESLAQQMAYAISSVSLPQDAYEYLTNAVEEEAKASTQPLLAEKALGDRKIKEAQAKLDRLLDAHLEGLVDKQEYQAKKDVLLSSQVTLRERRAQLESGALSWLEPARAFLKAARDASPLSASGDLVSQKNFLQKVGSNHHLAGRRLHFEFQSPWALLGGSSFEFKNLAGNSGGSFKPHPSASADGNFLKTRYNYNMWSFFLDVRTHFKDKYGCAGISIPSTAQKTIPELEADEVNPPKRTSRKL